MQCDQCEMLTINGVACHETGCPNSGARWDSESEMWVKQRVCFDCGCTVDADDPCCSAEEGWAMKRQAKRINGDANERRLLRRLPR